MHEEEVYVEIDDQGFVTLKKEDETYICSNCKKEFIKDRNDEEAIKEFKYYFDKDATKSVVCDDCFKEIMKYHRRILDYGMDKR